MENNLLKIAPEGNTTVRKQICIFSSIAIAMLMSIMGCQKPDPETSPTPSSASTAKNIHSSLANFTQVNLVSDIGGFNAQILDKTLVNAWGISFGPTGGIWISANDANSSVIYDQNGNTLRPPVHIPFGTGDANPTGQVFNPTSSFVIPGTGTVKVPSKFIFATENGTIAAWASGNEAITVADRSKWGAVYKGIELVKIGNFNIICATDFHNGRVDMFDQNFKFIGNHKFRDTSIPMGYAPFNIRQIDGRIFITYAKQLAPDNHDDEKGLGNGYVSVFDSEGNFMHRFASQGTLNSPWGIERLNTTALEKDHEKDSKKDHDDSLENQTILIGNFGDGHINVYDGTGKFIGQLGKNNSPLTIEGLWAISYPPQNNQSYQNSSNRIYFTAGPADESHGVFGYLTPTDK